MSPKLEISPMLIERHSNRMRNLSSNLQCLLRRLAKGIRAVINLFLAEATAKRVVKLPRLNPFRRQRPCSAELNQKFLCRKNRNVNPNRVNQKTKEIIFSILILAISN